MNDTRKLLLAFIEASGFDVEATPRIIETPENLLVKTMLVTDYKVTKKGPVNIRPEGFKITFKNGKWQ